MIISAILRNNKYMKDNNTLKNIKEIEDIIRICEENRIEITGSVLLRSAEEIEAIIKVCKKYEIEITGVVFFKECKRDRKNNKSM